jgi:hypothetical protein
MRWRQFETLVKGGAAFREPGFALSLYYAVSDDEAVGKRAIAWALSPDNAQANNLRQLALVYDWCQAFLSEQQSVALKAKIRQLAKFGGDGVSARRDRVLAAIATADDADHPEQSVLTDIIEHWWRGGFVHPLGRGGVMPEFADFYALLEMMHAIRDNLKIDLREDAPDYFAHLPTLLIAASYPAPYRAPENEFRIPVYAGGGPPELDRAALARAAGLSMVAYDTNALENQFLQGWLIQDRFIMTNGFGAPYEFLWANPYQPGLSYYQLPLLFHDSNTGALFARSTWEDTADWFGLYAGVSEFFHQGRAARLTPDTPVHVGDTTIVTGQSSMKFHVDTATVLVVGLKPDHKYLVETDDEELREVSTDRSGTLVLEYPAARKAGVRIREAT